MKNKKIAYLLIILLFFLFAFGIILEKKGRNCPSSASTKYKTDDDKTKEDEKNVTEIKDRQGRAVILIAKGVSLNKQNEKNAPKKKDRSGKANKNNNSEAIENSNSGVNNNSEVIKDSNSNSGVNENNSSELTVSKEIEVNKGKEKKEAEDFDPRGKEKIETGEETTAHVHCFVPVTRRVIVAEQGHWVTDVTEEWDEYIYEWHEYCSICELDLTENYGGANTEEAFLHRLSHGSDMNYYAKESDQLKEIIHHDKEVTEYYVVDREAHEEKLIDHYVCSCGKIKYED